VPGPLPRIALTAGEPAGIGPELLIKAAHTSAPASLVAVCDPALLEAAAAALGLPTRLLDDDGGAHEPGSLRVIPVSLALTAVPGKLDTANAGYVLETLDIACDGCLDGHFDAMVTGPVQKSVINDAGIPFSGHTEYLAQRCGGAYPVMMLVAQSMRVALLTTHLPLREVPAALDAECLERTIRIIDHDLRLRFGVAAPRISVLGLNPHAGEGGHLGREEIDIIIPLLERLRAEGLTLTGPLPADTAFTHRALENTDAVLAMYHDQGLPVIKHAGFGEVVNVTLGLPIVRTSVDHGTALDLAGSGRATPGSLLEAIRLAIRLGASRADERSQA
jgi:4-hydroxythreonine-4-phosphate dehydrogenase